MSLSGDHLFQAQGTDSLGAQQAELLVMTVEIGDGRQDVITIYENDDPDQLAKEFARKHGLDSAMQRNLSMLIRQNKELVEMRAATSSPDNFKWTDYLASTSMVSNTEAPAETKSAVQAKTLQHKGSVFERLYLHNKKRVQTAQAPQRTKSEATINYGEWLYVKGLKQKESHKQKCDTQAKAKETKLAAEVCTFRPVINEYSNLLSPRYFEKTEDLLVRKSMNYKERLEDLKAKAFEAEMKECSFVPKTLNKGKSFSSAKDVPKYMQLYALAQKPQPQTASRPAGAKKSMQDLEAIADRLANYKKESENKLQRLRDEAEQNSVTQQGKPLFRPETNSGTAPGRLGESGSIHEYLYAKRGDRQARNSSKADSVQQHWNAQATAQKISKNSEKIFDQYRGKQYAKLFSVLDSDDDGRISANAVNLDGLEPPVLEVLQPLFQVLDGGAEVDVNSFVSHLEEIWKTLNVEQRSHLIKREPRAQDSEDFRLGLSQASHKLASQRRESLPEDMYERLQNAQKLTDLKLQKLKEMDQEAEMQECTFSPQVKKRRSKRT